MESMAGRDISWETVNDGTCFRKALFSNIGERNVSPRFSLCIYALFVI